MKLLIKVLINNFFKIRVRNLFINNQIKGERGKDSFILAFGDFKYGAKKGAKINISNGQLVFNKIFSKPDYGKGVLKMLENSTINVKNNFDIFRGIISF